jgi:hypothetical protein
MVTTDHVRQLLEGEDVGNVCDVGLQVHLAVRQVNAFAEPGQGGRIHHVSGSSEHRRDVLPDPATGGGAKDAHDSSHQSHSRPPGDSRKVMASAWVCVYWSTLRSVARPARSASMAGPARTARSTAEHPRSEHRRCRRRVAEHRLQRRILGRSTTTRAASPCNVVVTRATLGCSASRSPIACFKTPLPWPVMMRTATVSWACSRRKKASVRCNASRRWSPCRSSVGSPRLGGSDTRASMVLRCAMRDHCAPDSGCHK